MFNDFNELNYLIDELIIDYIGTLKFKDALCELHHYSWVQIDEDITYCGG